MNQQERLAIGEKWLALAMVYNNDIKAASLKILLDSVDDLHFEKVNEFLNNWPKITRYSRHPYPSEIRDWIHPKSNSRDVANELSRKIDKCVSKYGYAWCDGVFFNGSKYFEGAGKYHATFKEAVISEIGQVGWYVVCSRGGWLAIRNSANEMEEGTFIAQMRDQIQSTINLKEQGVDITAIEYPDKTEKIENNILNLVDFKTIT